MSTFGLSNQYESYAIADLNSDEVAVVSGGSGLFGGNGGLVNSAVTFGGIGYGASLARGAATGARIGMFGGIAGAVGGAVIGAGIYTAASYFSGGGGGGSNRG